MRLFIWLLRMLAITFCVGVAIAMFGLFIIGMVIG